MIIAYTDGACKGNGSQHATGGFGVHITYPNGDTLNIWGGEHDTTNNRMELMGAIVALERTPMDTPLQLWTDSAYVKNGITKWIQSWKKNQWRKSDKTPVLNVELWQRLDMLTHERHIDWQWIKGHAGHVGNEIADNLANLGAKQGYGEEFIASQHHLTPSYDGYDDYANRIYDDSPYTSTEDVTPITPTQNKKSKKLVFHDSQNPQYNGDTSKANSNFWSVLPNPINRDKADRQLIMDTETTGTAVQQGDRIVEVGIIEMVGRKFTGQQVHLYLNPDKQMSDEVIKVHGISNEFVKDKPKFADVAHRLYEFMIGAEIIAHNADFDMGFLQAEFEKVGIHDFNQKVQVLDTLALARQMYPAQKNSLDALRKRLNVGNQDRTFHGALLDSEILAEVYLAMTGGQIALNMTEDVVVTESDNELVFTNLSELAHLLLKSCNDFDADAQWRSTQFAN